MIQKKIFQYFDGNSDLHVLFIFDHLGQIESELLECEWPAGYRYVSFDGQWFTVKYNLVNDWKDDKVVLLFKGMLPPTYQDGKMDFPLYGEMKANMVFSEESYLTFMQLKGIHERFGPYIARHIGELQLAKYDKILEGHYDPKQFSIDVCNRGLISGYMGATKLLSWEEIIVRLVCMDFNDPDKCSSVFRSLRNNQDSSDALAATLTGICGQSFYILADKKFQKFAESYKYNSITQHLTAINADDYKTYKINNSVVLQRLNSFREVAAHSSFAEQFDAAIEGLSKNIKEEKIILWYGADAEYGYINESLCWPIIENIVTNGAISNPVESNEKLRAFSLKLPLNTDYQEVIEFLSNACFLLEKINGFGSYTLKTPQDYIKKYTGEFYLIDTYYRLCVGEFRDINSSLPVYEKLHTFKDTIDAEYSKAVNLLNLEWVKCIKETGVRPIEMDGILHQHEFYYRKLKGVDAKRVVIISDALRYEVAVELLNCLGKDKHEATIEPALAVLPTETKYSKLTLLPYSQLKYSNCDVTVDGDVLNTTPKRTAHVQRYEPDALCIDFKQLEKLSPNQKRELFKSHLVYVFHDVIDSIGHDNPNQTASACKTAVDELKKFIPSLHATYNVANVYVTSDHGFLYNDKLIKDKDKHQVKENYEERTTRYYITDGNNVENGVTKFLMSESSAMSGDNLYIGVPSGSNRFFAEGGSYQYTHGGATLQEMVIPVIYSHLRRDDKKNCVGLTLIENALNMLSSRVKFSIVQSDAVSEDYKERKISCGIYEGNKLVTNEKEVNLSSTDANPQNRFYTIELTLSKPVTGGLLELRIYDVTDKDKLNPLAKATVTNKTLIEQDF